MFSDNIFDKHRLLLVYKGDISALIMFAQQSNGSVCFPGPLPPLSTALEPEEFGNTPVSVHPSTLTNKVCQSLKLDNQFLQAEPNFCEQVDAPGGIITVHLARFMLLDPPHQLMQTRDCKMRTLPELRGRPPADMELLRRAYVALMEG
ncbi:MAG: hypothetical protein ACU836_04295 [Gammaproteobacteria bacterium]